MTGTDGWAWFAEAGAVPPDAPEFLSRCFATPDGRRTLALLKTLTLERALGPESSDAALRHLEGQRRLVATLLVLAARSASRIPPTEEVP
jgi:hypothetical protein